MTTDPIAEAVLRRLTELRPPHDPLHAFAATVLSGEATLRSAATHPAFTEALTATADTLPRDPEDLTSLWQHKVFRITEQHPPPGTNPSTTTT